MKEHHINILLESNDTKDGWVFSIITNLESQNDRSKYSKLKEKNGQKVHYNCGFCDEKVFIDLFYDTNGNLEENFPGIASVFVEEMSKDEIKQELEEIEMTPVTEIDENNLGIGTVDEKTLKKKRIRKPKNLLGPKPLPALKPTKIIQLKRVPGLKNLPPPKNIQPILRKIEVSPSKKPAAVKKAVKLKLPSYLKYLPPGLLLPNWSKYKSGTFCVSQIQPDQNIAYVQRRNGHLWITNFETISGDCDLCKINFNDFVALTLHRYSVHFFPGDCLECCGCGKLFDISRPRYFHTLYCPKKSSIDISFCKICSKKFDTYDEFDKHFHAQHACNPTSVLYDIPDNQIMQPEDSYECHHCNKFYYDKKTLLNHLQQVHFRLTLPYHCPECVNPVITFETKASFELHMLKCHQNIELHNFELQSHSNTELLNVEPHIIKSTKNTEPHNCTYCDARYSSKNSLGTHIKRKHNPNPKHNDGYTCEICGKLFKTKHNLDDHLLTHLPESERKHKCQYCEKRFNQLDRLKEHEADHRGEKRYKCDQCGKEFSRKINFDDHMRHHNNNPYVCEICKKGIYDRSTYQKHLKRHEKELGIKLTYTREERRLKNVGFLERIQPDFKIGIKKEEPK